MAVRRCSQKLPRKEWIECLAEGDWPASKLEPGKGTAYHREIAGCHVFYMRDHNNPNVWTYHIDSNEKYSEMDGWSDRKFDTETEVKFALMNRLADGLGK